MPKSLYGSRRHYQRLVSRQRERRNRVSTQVQPTTTIKIVKSMTNTKIEVIKTNDQPTTTIEITKSMTNIKMDVKTELKMKEKMIMVTKTLTRFLS